MAQGCAWRRMNSADAAIGLCAEGFRGPVQFLKIAGFANPPCGKVRAVTLRTPYLLFIGDAPDQLAAKTAAGIAFWRPEICLGQLRLPGCKADLGIPDMTIEEAAESGVKTVIVGTKIGRAHV